MDHINNGRRNLEHQDLKNGICAVSIALHKSWSKTPTYWVDLYAFPMGFRVVKQWSFYRAATKERVEDFWIENGVHTVYNLAADAVEDAVCRLLKRDYSVKSVCSRSAWTELGHIIDVRLNSLRENPNSARALPKEDLSPADKLQQVLKRRARRAKW